MALLLLLTSLSLSPGTAQFPTADTAQPPPIDFGRSAGILLGVFLTTFFFLIIFIYMRCCVHQDNNTPVPERPAPWPHRGLEDSAIEALPAVVYSEVKDHKIGRNALECAVCLSEFEDHETLKLLPKCDHVFHSDCIATWLSTHVTCPVCRFDLSAGDVVVVEPEVELTSASVDPEVGRTETPTRTPPVVESSPRSMSLWSFKASRSRSARPGRFWTEEERGRFTLRLPENVRRELLAGRMRRSDSVAVVFARKGTEGRGEWSPRAELTEVFLEEEERERVRYPMSKSLERELRRSRSASLAIGSQPRLKWKRRWFAVGDKDGEGTSGGTTFDYCICPGGVFC